MAASATQALGADGQPGTRVGWVGAMSVLIPAQKVAVRAITIILTASTKKKLLLIPWPWCQKYLLVQRWQLFPPQQASA